MPTLSLPSNKFATARFGLRTNTQISVSQLNGYVQTLELPGARWTCVFTVPTLYLSTEGPDWQAFLVSLMGPAGRFYGYDPSRRSPRGNFLAGSDTPRVQGSGQTGSSLKIDGMRPVISNVGKAGDYFEVNGEYKMLTAAFNSDSNGEATIFFKPELRSSPADNALLTFVNPTMTMMLMDDDQAQWDVDPFLVRAISFAAMEAF